MDPRSHVGLANVIRFANVSPAQRALEWAFGCLEWGFRTGEMPWVLFKPDTVVN